MATPEVRYVKSGDVNIAYEVTGTGALDLVYVPGWTSHLEIARETPAGSRFIDRLASFSRLIRFDKRGTGMSDRVAGAPSLELRMDDVRAVMDAVGSARAALFGVSEGGPMSALFAATYPERTVALIIYGSFARRVTAPDYPWGMSRQEWDAYCEAIEVHWGTDAFDIELRAPSLANDPAAREAWVKTRRRQASPGAARALAEMNGQIDIRAVLPTIRVPTLVMHVAGDQIVSVGGGRYLAEQIPGARFIELPGNDHIIGPENGERLADEIEEFLTGVRPAPDPDRFLTTVLFTDLVGSTEQASALGDRRWRELLAEHNALVRRELARFRGKEMDTAGDGFFGTFDGPARAIRCAAAIREQLSRLGLRVRAGIHTGECVLLDGKASGIAVVIGARIAASARPDEILVSRTVHDLVAGSGISFDVAGTHSLKGIDGDWQLFSARTA